MSHAIDEFLSELMKRILHAGGLVEQAVDQALHALFARDADAAVAVIAGDEAIDDAELEIEELCVEVLARHHPVARDLRFIAAVMKINSDLERIGDLAVNIAERAQVLTAVDYLPFRPDVSRMAAVTKLMLRRALDALVRLDVPLARRVWGMDDEPNRLFREIIGQAVHFMEAHPERIGDVLHLLGAIRNLERIADHATNIAEDVIFVVRGRIVRHRIDELGVVGETGGTGDDLTAEIDAPRSTGPHAE